MDMTDDVLCTQSFNYNLYSYNMNALPLYSYFFYSFEHRFICICTYYLTALCTSQSNVASTLYVLPVVVFLAVVMDDLQSVFSSPGYPLPLKINPLLSTSTPPPQSPSTKYISQFLEIFSPLPRNLAFHFESLQMLSAPLMP